MKVDNAIVTQIPIYTLQQRYHFSMLNSKTKKPVLERKISTKNFKHMMSNCHYTLSKSLINRVLTVRMR